MWSSLSIPTTERSRGFTRTEWRQFFLPATERYIHNVRDEACTVKHNLLTLQFYFSKSRPSVFIKHYLMQNRRPIKTLKITDIFNSKTTLNNKTHKMSAEYKVYSCSSLKLQSSFSGTMEFHTYHPATRDPTSV